MVKLEETKVVNIDGVEHQVVDLPDTIKRLVGFHDHWREKLIDAESTFLMLQSAYNAVRNEIVVAINKHLETQNADPASEGNGQEPPILE